MKIENGTLSPTTSMDSLLKKSITPAPAETLQTAKTTGEAYSVDLSATTEHVTTPQSSDEINRDRVAAIRDQLASGTYNISGKDVANKILGVLKG